MHCEVAERAKAPGHKLHRHRLQESLEASRLPAKHAISHYDGNLLGRFSVKRASLAWCHRLSEEWPYRIKNGEDLRGHGIIYAKPIFQEC